MSEYIKREDAIKHLRKAEDLYRKTMESSVRADMIAHCVKLISEVPAADVAEVVRCRDCCQYDESEHLCGLYGIKHWDGFFCMDGSRRDDNA